MYTVLGCIGLCISAMGGNKAKESREKCMNIHGTVGAKCIGASVQFWDPVDSRMFCLAMHKSTHRGGHIRPYSQEPSVSRDSEKELRLSFRESRHNIVWNLCHKETYVCIDSIKRHVIAWSCNHIFPLFVHKLFFFAFVGSNGSSHLIGS